MKILKRFLLLLRLPQNLRGLEPGMYMETHVDEGGQTYVMIRLEDFHRLGRAAGLVERRLEPDRGPPC